MYEKQVKLKATAKTLLRKLDRFSPYPLFCPCFMSDKEKALFYKALKESRHYLEFGSGGSTVRAIQNSKVMIYTVDSSPECISSLRKYFLVRFFEKKRLHIYPVNIGPVYGWGFPESKNFEKFFENYSAGIFQAIDSRLIDVALVDGRFRVACTLKTVLHCHDNSNMKILIHDFWNRPHYHIVLKYLHTVNRADTLGVFSVKKNIDLKSVEHDYAAFKLIPE